MVFLKAHPRDFTLQRKATWSFLLALLLGLIVLIKASNGGGRTESQQKS
jgi:hypothetical protein